MSCVIWLYSGAIRPDYRQGWTDYCALGQCIPFYSQCLDLCLHMCVVTFGCGGDLPGHGVDLEQGGVVFVGDLSPQTVSQLSIGGLTVVPIRCRNLQECDTWETDGEKRGAKQSEDVTSSKRE